MRVCQEYQDTLSISDMLSTFQDFETEALASMQLTIAHSVMFH
jgi:hypothetical protein